MSVPYNMVICTWIVSTMHRIMIYMYITSQNFECSIKLVTFFHAYVEGDMNTQKRYSEPVDNEFESRYHHGHRSTTKGIYVVV